MSEVIGIGTDITECLRIAKMIERHGELFINRVYTAARDPYCQTRKQATQHFAGRWAAKEAVLKALGTGWRRGISWRDIEVRQRARRPAGRSDPRRRQERRRATRRHQRAGQHLPLPHPRDRLCRGHRGEATSNG